MHRYKDLQIWKNSRLLCKDIYELTTNFPEAEKYGLTSQLRRASVSVPSNIAEGSSRKSNVDFSRFLSIALGSCYEIETQLILSVDLGYVSEEKLQAISDKLLINIKMISKFQSTLKNNPKI